MEHIVGFYEEFGDRLNKRDYLCGVMGDIARRFNFKKILIPVIEKADSFSEKVIGKSPWPEWNKKGCFYFEIENYFESYREKCKKESILLIPEGTVSATRWLGNMLDENAVSLPCKVFYEAGCYRNELISTLSSDKRREFTQFGMEIMGSSSLLSDLEVISVADLCLKTFGLTEKQIRIRINDIRLFNAIGECGLGDRKIEIKELLDSLAEVKAGKKPERYGAITARLKEILSSYPLTDGEKRKFDFIINQREYDITGLEEVFCEDVYAPAVRTIKSIRDACCENGVNAVADLCVIRSHEYYTGLSFEMDAVVGGKSFVEIAGGGRYDRLVENFNSMRRPIPCTGFAFGVERVLNLLESLGVFDRPVTHSAYYDFGVGSVKTAAVATKEQFFKAFKEIQAGNCPCEIVYNEE